MDLLRGGAYLGLFDFGTLVVIRFIHRFAECNANPGFNMPLRDEYANGVLVGERATLMQLMPPSDDFQIVGIYDHDEQRVCADVVSLFARLELPRELIYNPTDIPAMHSSARIDRNEIRRVRFEPTLLQV